MIPGWKGIVVKGVDVGMVSGHLGMPGVFVDVVDLRNVDQIVPGDGHVNLCKPVPRASAVDKPACKMLISPPTPPLPVVACEDRWSCCPSEAGAGTESWSRRVGLSPLSTGGDL